LACRLNFNDGEKIGCENYSEGYINNSLIELDLGTNEVSITRGVDISSMLVIDDEKFAKIAVCFNGEHSSKIGELTEDGLLFDEVLPKLWVSPKSNMGYPTKVKQITECLIKTKGDCVLKIATNNNIKKFNITGKAVAQRVKVNLSGEELQVAFASNTQGETYISCPQITINISE